MSPGGLPVGDVSLLPVFFMLPRGRGTEERGLPCR
jgi:hypothetical protein